MMSLLKRRRGEAKGKSEGSLLRVSWGLGPVCLAAEFVLKEPHVIWHLFLHGHKM